MAYLHLGQNTVTPTSEIVGIFDLDKATVGRHTKSFLEQAQKKKQVIDVCDDLPKSFVVCQREKNTRVYITQVSAATLRKRNENP